MRFSELLRWQREGYARSHQSRANLLVHIGAVCVFPLGNVALVVGLAGGSSD